MDKKNKNKIRKILAWIGLIVITIFLCTMFYGVMTSNTKLILSMIVALVFVSVLFWIGIKLAKDQEAYEEILKKSQSEKEMYDITHKKTRGL